MLMRAYYEPEHIAVIDCLLDLQHRQANKSVDAHAAHCPPAAAATQFVYRSSAALTAFCLTLHSCSPE
jgi:hypothetical protein